MLHLVLTIITFVIISAAGNSPAAPASLQKPSPAEVLSAAAQRGKELQIALREYSFDAELTIQTVSPADTITGKYYRFSRISFGRDGTRQERVLENTSTLPNGAYIGTLTAANLTGVYQFMVTPEALTQYDLNYIGREVVDELNTIVFDVKPRIKPSDKSHERFLRGRIWIDDQDLCVVKIAGEVLPAPSGHRIPTFETYFQSYDRYWFPAYTSADDNIRVGDEPTRVMVKLRCTGYKKAGAKR